VFQRACNKFGTLLVYLVVHLAIVGTLFLCFSGFVGGFFFPETASLELVQGHVVEVNKSADKSVALVYYSDKKGFLGVVSTTEPAKQHVGTEVNVDISKSGKAYTQAYAWSHPSVGSDIEPNYGGELYPCVYLICSFALFVALTAALFLAVMAMLLVFEFFLSLHHWLTAPPRFESD